MESSQVSGRPASADGSVSSSSIHSRTPRSLLKNIFTWKKAPITLLSDSSITSNSRIGQELYETYDEQRHASATIEPSMTHRSRSDTATVQHGKSRSKSRQRSKSHCRAIWDPPPLFQAYKQAFIYDTLQVPNRGLLDWLPRNSSNRSSPKTQDGADDENVDACSRSTSHRKSMSDPSTSSLCQKLFFAFENGHILQYKAEGSQDRLPERVIELSRDSVAFASDAVAGQHWVLEICPYGKNDDTKISPAKSTWSRMAFKTADNKRLADKLLLIFENPDALFTWLIAIRKQIEGFGGIEYQPDTPPLPQPETKRPMLRHTSSEYFKRKNGNLFSRSASNLPLRIDDHTAHEKDLPQLPTTILYQRSISTRSDATSSIGTTTSSNQYRESYSDASTAGTILSSAMSATSPSPTNETFSAIPKPVLVKDHRSRVIIDRSISRTPASPLSNSKEQTFSPDIDTVKPFNRTSRAVELQGSGGDQVFQTENRKTFSSSTSPTWNGHGDIFISTYDAKMAQDTEAILELRSRLKQAKLTMSASDSRPSSSSTAQGVHVSTSPHSRKSSPETTSKAGYGLFPKNVPVDIKEGYIALEDTNATDLTAIKATDRSNIPAPRPLPIAPTFGGSKSARSGAASKRPGPIALPHLLALTEIESPMRTPAVTDAMLDTNFGIMPNETANKPASPLQVRVPGFGDVKMDTNLLRSFQKHQGKSKSPPPSPKPCSLSLRRSLPNFHYGLDSVVSAPVGPPPSGPLPAVPTVTTTTAGSKTSPKSKRVSTQSTGNRRMSAKSMTSTRKNRSRAPSLTYQSPVTRVSLPSGVQSAALPKINIQAFTIGQVSIVSAPPRASGSSRHKKSSSTSSAKSHRSRKGHARTLSGKSMHSTGNGISSFSDLMTPSCVFEPDPEFNGKGCFGISTPRTGAL